jgi:TPR repeat protein
MAQKLRRGDGVRKDLAAAVSYYDAACEKGHAQSCDDLGTLLALGPPPLEKDGLRAVDRSSKGCTLGLADSCYAAGNTYLQGSRGKSTLEKSYERAADMFQRGCDGGSGVSCDALSRLYAAGQGVPKNKALARKLRNRAAKLGFEHE